MAGNELRRKLEAGGVAHGAAAVLGSPLAAELLAVAGFDYVYLDQQHGLVSLDTLVALLQATARTGCTPLVRVARNDEALIGRALDAGAAGVIVPLVETAAEAERAAAACRYAPRGSRSWGPLRAGDALGSSPEAVNAEVLCLVMVETARGVERVEEIASVPGVDGVYVGAADLALTLGLPPRAGLQEGVHAEAVARIVAACTERGIVAAISGDPAEMAAAGFRMVTLGSDAGFLAAGVRQAVERAAAVAS